MSGPRYVILQVPPKKSRKISIFSILKSSQLAKDSKAGIQTDWVTPKCMWSPTAQKGTRQRSPVSQSFYKAVGGECRQWNQCCDKVNHEYERVTREGVKAICASLLSCQASILHKVCIYTLK